MDVEMKTRMKRAVTGFIIGLVAETPAAYAACEDNVDNVEAYYVNGMFTDFSDFEANRQAISKFISGYLAASNFNSDVKGTHNISEGAYNQVMEVAKQKTEDGNATKKQAVLEFINGDYDYLNSEEGVAAVQEYLEAIKGAYEYTLNEEDGLKAKQGLEELLDTCSRVVMITHSQGNFYGNALLNGVYASYHFPNGYALAQFPMLGNMQIASPVNVPGGAAASLYPELIGHLTNDNDLVMRLVRSTRGSVPSNFNAPDIEADKSGHSLEKRTSLSMVKPELLRPACTRSADLLNRIRSTVKVAQAPQPLAALAIRLSVGFWISVLTLAVFTVTTRWTIAFSMGCRTLLHKAPFSTAAFVETTASRSSNEPLG